MIMITTFYASLLAILLVMLSMRVIGVRGNPMFRVLSFKTAGDQTLERVIRAHGNLTEYAPLMLILMFLAENDGASAFTIHAYGASFLLGRVMHAWCFAMTAKSVPLRVGGTAITLTAVLGLAIKLLVS